MIKIIFKNFGLNCNYVFLINVVCKNIDIFVCIRFIGIMVYLLRNVDFLVEKVVMLFGVLFFNRVNVDIMVVFRNDFYIID